MAKIKKNREEKRKEVYKVKQIKKAIEHTQRAIRLVLKKFKTGMTEKEVTKIIKEYARRNKLEIGFLIVQGDKNTAKIHSKPSNNKINKILLIDVGLKYNGYFADITRTYLLKPTKEMKKIYGIVRKAYSLSIKKIKEEVSCKKCHCTAKEIIEKYGHKLKHSLGHGVGLQVHEFPKISKNSKHCFKRGMIFTIEPGIYIKGKFGVRIEDMFLLNKKLRRLSRIKIPVYK